MCHNVALYTFPNLLYVNLINQQIKVDANEPLKQTQICLLSQIFTPISVYNNAAHPVYRGINTNIL
jgi:hypothetical protein